MDEEERFWDRFATWQEAEDEWDRRATQIKSPLRKHLAPRNIPLQEKNLRWKGFWWLLFGPNGWNFFARIIFHPFRHLSRYLSSIRKKNPYSRDGDLFLYGISSFEEAKKHLADEETVLLVGFSYCQKPHECPQGRFSEKCDADLDSPICQQCTIGKAFHSLPKERTHFAVIPTVSDIGVHCVRLIKKHKKVFFLISTCEMALSMFGDFAHAGGVKGIGFCLQGRVCSTMKAFKLSEEGIKTGRTMYDSSTEKNLFSCLKCWSSSSR